MIQIGDQVLYGIHGVCRIIGTELRSVDRRKVEYFILEPLSKSDACFYVPTQNQAALSKLQPLLDAQALRDLLTSEQANRDSWIPDEGRRKNRYRELINCGDRAAIVSMVRSLYRHRQTQAEMGRKFHLCDENFLRDAEKLLSSEISLVLGIAPNEIPAYLQETSLI